MKKNTKIISIIVTILAVFLLGYLEIGVLKDYGVLVFFVIPFLLGFLPPFIAGTQRKLSRRESYDLSAIAFIIAFASLLIFAIEGLICLMMAFPIAALLTFVGAYLGHKFNERKWINKSNTTILLLLLSFGTMSFDHLIEPDNLIAVRTKIFVDAPIKQVWKNVVTFHKIAEPTDWIFKTGISCPTDATIKGTGVGAVRYCNFTTGSFVEPITTWNEPNLLQFDVIEQPVPMNEFNPFWDIHPQHLDGYFVSQKGQFKLTKLSENKTELEGTTWYTVDITPQFYWKLWSDFIIHRIHKRVLNHIQSESETGR